MTDNLTAADALERLITGNRRFAAGTPDHPRQDPGRRAELAAGQHPFAVVLGCSDSRPAPEVVFDQGLGDLFVVRTAGEVLGAEVLGSIEYGADLLGCPLVVVLGHESCGAVAAACAAVDQGTVPDGYVGDLVEHVIPSVLSARAAGRLGTDEIEVEQVGRTIDLLLERSPGLARRVAGGQAAVIGMRYRLADGVADVVAARGLPMDAASA